MSSRYDALIVVSFGGPEGPKEVVPFLENVVRGKPVPRKRLLEVAEHYKEFGGVSPLNEQNRQLIAALREELLEQGPELPIYWGNRNWHPLLPDTLRKMKEDGVERALGFFTSAYSSYSGCRQYRENIQAAQAEIGEGAPEVDKIRVFYNHPRFIEANCERVREALEQISEAGRPACRLIFTAHSIPLNMAALCSYEMQLEETARLIGEGVGREDWELVYQSRSGPPSQPWLEPDICDYLEDCSRQGLESAVIAPIGFLSDHMEILFDLDTEARKVCAERGIEMVRAATVGTHPQFIRMIRELILERMQDSPERPAIGYFGPSHDICPDNCCCNVPGRPAGR